MRTVFFVLICCIIAAGCSKKKVETQLVTLKRAQTQCADPWQNTASDTQTLANITAYLQSQNLYIDNLSISLDASPQTCLACLCKTGKYIYVTTLNDSTTIANYKQVGFNP